MATSRRLPSWDLAVTSGEIPESFSTFRQPTYTSAQARKMIDLDDVRLTAQMMLTPLTGLLGNQAGVQKTTFSDDR
jgi:hypothetical protein